MTESAPTTDDWNKQPTEQEWEAIRFGDPETALHAIRPEPKVLDEGRFTEERIEDLVNRVGF
jgi:hypothetical protein